LEFPVCPARRGGSTRASGRSNASPVFLHSSSRAIRLKVRGTMTPGASSGRHHGAASIDGWAPHELS
jgi:hypothetical protein